MNYLTPFLHGGVYYVGVFLIVLTVLVFVHEFGHYWVARRNGVRIEVFSIGFGPELFGWNDRLGTRWKFSAIPLGGYVKMFGDADATSMPGTGQLRQMTPEERAVSFHYKRLGQRAAIVAAGPIANFLFAILIQAVVFATWGQLFTPPDVGAVQPESAAAAAGFQPGDVILSIDGSRIERFEDVQQIVRQNRGEPIHVVVRRGDAEQALTALPRVTESTDRFGNQHRQGLLGISRPAADYIRRDPVSAVWYASKETVNITAGALVSVGQIVAGSRSSQELGGPL